MLVVILVRALDGVLDGRLRRQLQMERHRRRHVAVHGVHKAALDVIPVRTAWKKEWELELDFKENPATCIKSVNLVGIFGIFTKYRK